MVWEGSLKRMIKRCPPCRGVVILLSSWWSLVSPDSKPQLPDGGGLRTVCRWPQSRKGPALPLLPGGQHRRQEQQELEAGQTRASDRVSVSLIQGSSLSLGSGSATYVLPGLSPLLSQRGCSLRHLAAQAGVSFIPPSSISCLPVGTPEQA